jgi:multiple sugar transport system permease protein
MSTVTRPTPATGRQLDAPPKHANRRKGNHHRLLPYVLIAPAVIFELVVHVIPMLLGVWISFVRLTQLTIRRWTSAPFAGVDNYRNGLNPNGPIGADLWGSLARTTAFAILVVVGSWLIGMLAAYLLNTEFRGRGVFRTFFLVPFAMPAFVTIIGWKFMFNKDTGAVNHLLVDNLHLMDDKPFWLIGSNAFWVSVIVAIWRLWPFAFLMLMAALQTVPEEVYEASRLEGASMWRQFRSITLPMIRPANAVVILVMGLWSFNEFNVPYVLFGQQPPDSAMLLSNLIYSNSFVSFNFGLGAAMSVLLLVFLLVLSVFYVRLTLRGNKNA